MTRRFEFGSRTAAAALSGALCLALVAVTARGADPLLQTTRSWDGGAIAYPDGDAQITSVILRLEEGQVPPFHCHPVPTMGYVLKGKLEVETQAGRKAVFSAGESVVEVMRTVHRGTAIEAPVEIIVFYAGATDLPDTVLPADDPDNRYCAQ